ncbi:MAG: hypothetical protein CMF26_03245 [Kiloniella sp.]|nr:hypothetical protein [Kiloniella sp.]
MQRLDRMFLARLLAIFVLILTVVALSAVLSQAARLTDEVLRAGIALDEFGALILLLAPKMIELVTPLAFGIAVILACVQRNETGTTLLLRAAGRPARTDAMLIAGGSLAVGLGLFVYASLLVPLNQSQYRQTFALVKQQGIEQLSLPVGTAVSMAPGLSLRVEKQAASGVFEGVTVVDLRRPDARVMLRADRAELRPIASDSQQLLLRLINAEVIHTDSNGQTALLSFASTDLPLTLSRGAGRDDDPSEVLPTSGDRLQRADTRSSTALLQQISALGPSTRQVVSTPDRLAATVELTRRCAAALSVIGFGLFAGWLLLSRRPDGRGQTLPATGLLVFLIVYLMIQTALLSASGFNVVTGALVLAIALSPPILFPIGLALLRLAFRVHATPASRARS